MSPEQRGADEHRAALALLAAAADRRDEDVTVILGRGWRADRRAVMAHDLARWLADALRSHGCDPGRVAREVITDTITAEATGSWP